MGKHIWLLSMTGVQKAGPGKKKVIRVKLLQWDALCLLVFCGANKTFLQERVSSGLSQASALTLICSD